MLSAHLVSGARRYDHITPILATLHWLPVRERVTFKTAVLVWKCRVRINHAPAAPASVWTYAPAILAAPAVYCIHGRIIDQARGRQTVQNVNGKHAPSPSAATANTHQPSNCSNF